MWISLEGAHAVGKTTLFEHLRKHTPPGWFMVRPLEKYTAVLKNDNPRKPLDIFNNIALDLWTLGLNQKHIDQTVQALPESAIIVTDSCPWQNKEIVNSSNLGGMISTFFKQPDLYVVLRLPSASDNLFRILFSTDYRKELLASHKRETIDRDDIKKSEKMNPLIHGHFRITYFDIQPTETCEQIVKRLIPHIEAIQCFQQDTKDMIRNSSCKGT